MRHIVVGFDTLPLSSCPFYASCITCYFSQWGHDFRPDYLKMGILKQRFDKVPVFACTATADVEVRSDVKKILAIEVFSCPFDSNLMKVIQIILRSRDAVNFWEN